MCHLYTGLRTFSSVLVKSQTHVEVLPLPDETNAQFTDTVNEQPYDEQCMRDVLSLAMLTGSDQNKFAAGWFKNAFAKIGKVASSVGKALGPKALGMAANMLLPGSGGAVERGLSSALGSTGFGDNAVAAKPAGTIAFVAVKPTPEGVLYELIGVQPGRGYQPPFVAEITETMLTAAVSNFSGRSCELAFLLAALKEEGWRVKRGTFTGQIQDVSYYGNTVEFTVVPVAEPVEKISATSGDLVGLFPGGWFAHGKPTIFNARLLFGPDVDVDVDVVDMNEPQYGEGYHITATRAKRT